MNIKGKIHSIANEQVISDKFKKREFVVMTDETYPQHLPLQVTNDKCSLLDMFKVGESVDCSINLRGRLWNDPKTNIEKCFSTIEAWRIQKDEGTAPSTDQTQDDDLPF
jgi:hypothetical protein